MLRIFLKGGASHNAFAELKTVNFGEMLEGRAFLNKIHKETQLVMSSGMMRFMQYVK